MQLNTRLSLKTRQSIQIVYTVRCLFKKLIFRFLNCIRYGLKAELQLTIAYNFFVVGF